MEINITGIITKVIGTQNNKAEFVISIQNQGEFKCEYNGFLPVLEGDVITGNVKQLDKNKLLYVSQPFVCIPISENHIKQCFIKALRGIGGFGEMSAQKLYDKILIITKNILYSQDLKDSDIVIAYLTDLASKYYKAKSQHILNTLISGAELKESQVEALLLWWHNKRSMRRLYLLGLTKADILNCTKHVQAVATLNGRIRIQDLDEIFDQCITNPLVLSALPIEKALNIANILNIQITPEMKECGHITRTVYKHTIMNAWTCSPEFILIKHHPELSALRGYLIRDYKLFFDKNCVYLPYPYLVETKIADYLTKLIHKSDELSKVKIETPDCDSANYECKTLSEEQKNAIQGSLSNYISVITGGPGCGKTKIIKEICHNLTLREIPHICTSFTGKAVSRIITMTGETTAMTLDRMIMQFNKVMGFKHLIIDETSMVTSEILYRFIKAFPGIFRITFIGDVDQLPPTSWGILFKPLILSQKIPVYRLTHNYRIINNTNGGDRLLLENANELVNPERELDQPLIFDQGMGFTQIDGNISSIRSILNAMKDGGITNELITAISPYNESLKEINRTFQEVFLSNSDKRFHKDRLWCIGDRVMMTVNNYDINIMNGENGKVTELSDEGVTIKFVNESTHLFKWESENKNPVKTKLGDAYDDKGIDYEDRELIVDNIAHAFAISVHKSQGDQFPFVIIFIPTRGEKYSTFVNINLLYTAITRTERAVWIIGEISTINKVTMTMQPHRYDMLTCRLIELNKDITSFVPIKLIKEDDNFNYDSDDEEARLESMNEKYN